MKKFLLVTILLSLFAISLSAQKTYVRLGVGGGIGLGQYEGTNWASETETEISDNFEFKSEGLGGGFNASLAFGYMLSDNFGIELGVNEFFGLKKKVHYDYTSTGGTESADMKISGSMLQIVPAIVISPKLEKINPYARIGLIVGILPSVIQTYNSTVTNTDKGINEPPITTVDYKEKQYGGVALGFTAAGGVSLNLGGKFSLFGELVFNGITYSPSKGKARTMSVNGQDVLPDATTKDKEWTYEKNLDPTVVIPDSSPNKLPKTSVNFSNAEINIGVKLHL